MLNLKLMQESLSSVPVSHLKKEYVTLVSTKCITCFCVAIRCKKPNRTTISLSNETHVTYSEHKFCYVFLDCFDYMEYLNETSNHNQIE